MGVQRVERVVLDVRRSEFEPQAVVVVRQHDKGALLLLDVRDGGEPCDLAGQRAEAHLMCDTRGGLVESWLPSEGSVCTYTLGADITSFPGELRPYVELRRGGDVIAATGTFRLVVERAADLSKPQAEATVSRLDAAERAWREFQESAEIAESLREQAEASRAEAERLRDEAEAERRRAEKLRVEAERLRAEAESGRSEAEDARAEAERAREEAEGQRRDAEGLRAEEWSSASLSVGEVTSADEPSASIREGPGGRLDLLLDLALPRGPKGSDGTGVTTELKPGWFTVSVEPDGHLYLTHNDFDEAPPLSVRDGKLVYTIS